MRHHGTRQTAKLALALSTVLFTRCGGTKPPQKAAKEPARPVEYFHVDSATAGTLSGRIVLRAAPGHKPPAREAISMESEEGCQKPHAGHPVYDESIVVAKNGGLSNAFVYIQSGLEGKTFEPVKEAVGLDQHGCMFVPRVIGMRAGQTLDLKNSDPVSHNIHPMPKNNREWNEQQSPGSPDAEHKFARREVMIPVKCNVHQWMHAYIGVMEHPYFAVTGADGAFELPNLPPGDYTLAVWHEKLGLKEQKVHLAASG